MIAHIHPLLRFLKTRKLLQSNRYPRKPLDEFLEYLRFTKVAPYIPKGTVLLDVGAGDGNFLRYLDDHLAFGIGIDAHLPQHVTFGRCQLIRGYFPYDFETNTTFDVLTMMAVAEHIPMRLYPDVVDACWKYLKPNGLLLLTVQHPHVEWLLDALKALRIVEGFSMHEHYGFDPECLPHIFRHWKLLKRERWGFGFNNFFLFEKTDRP